MYTPEELIEISKAYEECGIDVSKRRELAARLGISTPHLWNLYASGKRLAERQAPDETTPGD